MVVKLLCLLIIILFAFFNIVLIFSPFFLILASLIGFSNLLTFKSEFLLLIVLFSMLVLALIIFYASLDFYFGFRVKKRLKALTQYKDTEYNEVIDIIFTEVKKSVKLTENEIDIYVAKNNTVGVYNYAFESQGVIVFTTGLLNYLVEEIALNSSKVLSATKATIVHEISHIKNKDNLIGEFVQTNNVFTGKIVFLYDLIFKILQKVIRIIPISAVNSGVRYIITSFASVILFILSIANKINLFLFGIFKKTMFQSLERKCDINVKKAFGEDGVKDMINIFQNYTNYFSTHNKTFEERIALLSKVSQTQDILYDKPEEQSGVFYLILYVILLLSLGCFLFYYFEGALILDLIPHYQNGVDKAIASFNRYKSMVKLLINSITSIV